MTQTLSLGHNVYVNQANQLPKFSEIKKIHIVGVGGTLMGAFAAYLKRSGMEVTGSDQNVYPPMSDVLQNAGVQLFSSYHADNILKMHTRPDLVVIGNVISANNPEAQAVMSGGYPYTSLPEAMEKLMLFQTHNLVVAGTHGKTTTSSLLAYVLRQSGCQPNFFIGGVSQDLPHSFHAENLSAGQYFVLEGDEYDTAFWDKVPKFNHYLPNDVILTSVEFDHADIYADFQAVFRAFEGLVKRIRTRGRLIACFDYESVKNLVKNSQVPVISYSSSREAGGRFYPERIRVDGEYTSFSVMENGRHLTDLILQIPGNHNILNALAVWIECRELGLDSQSIGAHIKTFKGVKRRQELRGEVQGVRVIDDFAHHPTAVRETLRALKLRYPHQRIITVFEPRSATSRRKVFQQEYVSAFVESDVTFIATPYDQSKIPMVDQFSSTQLVEDLKNIGKKAYEFSSIEQGVTDVASSSRCGDVVAVLSNGGFGGFIDKLLKKLSN